MAPRFHIAVLLLLIAGFTLFGASWAIPSLLPSQGAWTAEDARQYQEAAIDLHQFAGKKGTAPAVVRSSKPAADAPSSTSTDSAANTDPAPQLSSEFLAAQDRFRAKQAKLAAARNRGRTAATTLRWLGVGLMAVAIALYAGGRPNEG